MSKYVKNLLTLETYVYGKYGRTYIRNYVVGDRACIDSECECIFYRSIIDASKYDIYMILLVKHMVLIVLIFMTLETINN